VQRLRDLGEIEIEEGIFLFDQIYQSRETRLLDCDAEREETIRAFEAASDNAGDSDERERRLRDHTDRRFREVRAAFHRARGELTLAALSEGDEGSYLERYWRGQEWLIFDKPFECPAGDLSAEASEVRRVTEQLIGYSAAEGLRDQLQRMLVYGKTASEVSYGSSLAAIQEAREMKLIDAVQAATLIDEVVGERVGQLADGDRMSMRLARMAEEQRAQGVEVASSVGHEALQKQIDERVRRMMTVELRRIGEQWMADLLPHDPGGYERMCHETEWQAGVGL
jgi:hypothetical protein